LGITEATSVTLQSERFDANTLIRYCFWNVVDSTRKLSEFRDYYIEHRVHRLLAATMPSHRAGPAARTAATLGRFLPGSSIAAAFSDGRRCLIINSPPARHF